MMGKGNKKQEATVTRKINKEGDETVTFRKSWEEDGMNHSIEVKKVEGGYIIIEEEYGDKDGKYVHEREERVSMTNPFKKGEEDREEGELTAKDEKMFSWVDKPHF